MGTYVISKDEFIGDFEDFLRKQEGNVSAECIADSWNELAKEYGWRDKLKTTHTDKESELVEICEKLKVDIKIERLMFTKLTDSKYLKFKWVISIQSHNQSNVRDIDIYIEEENRINATERALARMESIIRLQGKNKAKEGIKK